jgi:transposase InsO family protein
MQLWYKSSELLNLPGMPSTRQGLIQKGKREDWVSRSAKGIGGETLEYHFDSLPPGTQAHLRTLEKDRLAQAIANDPYLNPAPLSVRQMQEKYWKAEFEGLPESAPNSSSFGDWFVPRFQAHLEIQKAYESYVLGCDLPKIQAQINFCTLYNGKAFDSISSETYGLIPSLSRSTLLAKRQALREKNSIFAICDGRSLSTRKGKSLIDMLPEIAEAVKICLAQGIFSAGKILYMLKNYHELIVLPTARQIRYWVQNFAQSNPQEYGIYKGLDTSPAFGKRDQDVSRPNQVWEVDASPTDIMLKFEQDGIWKKKRYTALALIDVYTRRAKVLIAERDRTDSVLALLKAAIQDWGIPEKLRRDNGKPFKSKQVTEFLDFLNVDIHACNPYSPKEKPFIERFFGTYQHDLVEVLPGYIGCSIEQRTKIRDRWENEKEVDLEMTSDQFQEWSDQWCADYHNREHSGIDCSPIRKLSDSMAQGWMPRRIEKFEYLDLISLKSADRLVRRQGIELNSRLYVAVGIEVGSKVHVRYDSEDPYQINLYKDSSLSESLGKAYWRDALPPEQLQSIAMAQAQNFKEIERMSKDTLRKARQKQKEIKADPAKALTVEVDVLETAVAIESLPQIIKNSEMGNPDNVIDLASQQKKRENLENREKFLAQAEETKNRELKGKAEQELALRVRKAKILHTYLIGGELSDQEFKLLEYSERNWPEDMVPLLRRDILLEAGMFLAESFLHKPRLVRRETG